MTIRKIFLIFHGRFPGEKAASLFAAKSAEAFANQGIEVDILVPRRRGVDMDTAYSYFNVQKNFKITRISILDTFGFIPNKAAFYLSYFSYSIFCFFYLKRRMDEKSIAYSNEMLPLYTASFATNNTMYEMHDFPESKLRIFGTMLRSFAWLLVHNKWKFDEVARHFTFPTNRIICESNAVDSKAFDLPISTTDARRRLGLSVDRKIAVYTGHLYAWKGVDTLAAAALELSPEFLVVFVGGTHKDVENFRQKYSSSKNIMIVGHVSHKDIPLWQKAADVLVIPNTAKEAISAYYTSPMKLYEYMASKKPIIASDIPSIREIVDEKAVHFFSPDDSSSLADMIVKVTAIANDRKAEEAFKIVQSHTWVKRSERILLFLARIDHQARASLIMERVTLLIRYLFSGFSAFGVNLGLLFLFTHFLHVWYLAASSIAFVLSVMVSFVAQKFFTFKDSSQNSVPHQGLWYVIIAVFNVAANGFFMYSLVDIIHIQYLLAQVISSAIIAAWSLLIYRFIIFPHAQFH